MSMFPGNNQNFEDKYYKYKKTIYGIAFAYMNNIHDTEDILQKAFIKLYNCKIIFDSEEDEKRWLIRITLNLCKDEKKSFWRKNRCNLDSVQEQGYSQEENEIIDEIRKLPSKYKDCIHLYYIEGYSVNEISKILSISESAVKMRLKRGREKLRLQMEE